MAGTVELRAHLTDLGRHELVIEIDLPTGADHGSVSGEGGNGQLVAALAVHGHALLIWMAQFIKLARFHQFCGLQYFCGSDPVGGTRLVGGAPKRTGPPRPLLARLSRSANREAGNGEKKSKTGASRIFHPAMKVGPPTNANSGNSDNRVYFSLKTR